MSKLPVYHIPVPEHVRNYLLQKLGPDPWPIHQNQFMGVVVKMRVERQPFRQLHRPAPTETDLRKCVRLTLPTALKHYTLTPESAKAIGEMLNKFFLEQMFTFVEAQIILDPNVRASLRRFINLYGINPESYDLEVARKAFRDHEQRSWREGGYLPTIYDQPQTLLTDYAKAS